MKLLELHHHQVIVNNDLMVLLGWDYTLYANSFFDVVIYPKSFADIHMIEYFHPKLFFIEIAEP